MKCTKCGNDLVEDAIFCNQCGTPVPSKTPEGMKVGDIGMIRAEAIYMGGSSPAPKAPEGDYCAICGLWVEMKSSFRCKKCGRSYLCQKHLNLEYKICEECVDDILSQNESTVQKVKAEIADFENNTMQKIEVLSNGTGNSHSTLFSSSKQRILIVDKKGKGDFTSISKAIESSISGDRIEILPGLYEEVLHINHPIELIGQVTSEIVEVCSDGDCALYFNAENGLVQNIKFRQVNGKQKPCIDILTGELKLVECSISCDGVCCINIQKTSNPMVRANRITGGEVGIEFADYSQGLVEHNEIRGQTCGGIFTGEASKPTILHNNIHSEVGGGINFGPNGGGIVEGNDIHDFRVMGISVKDNSDPIIRNNKIWNGKEASGIIVASGGKGNIIENEIWGTEYPGINVNDKGSKPIIMNNKIHQCKFSGISFRENCQGQAEDNEIWDIDEYGITIRNSNPSIRNNLIHDVRNRGIVIDECGTGLIENNDIKGVEKAGISVVNQSTPVIRLNRIYGGSGVGIGIGDSDCTIENNDIFDFESIGILITNSDVMVKSNRLSKNLHGIYLADNAKCTIDSNTLLGNNIGLQILGGSNPVVRSNSITYCKNQGIVIGENCGGNFINNSFTCNEGGDWNIHESSKKDVHIS